MVKKKVNKKSSIRHASKVRFNNTKPIPKYTFPKHANNPDYIFHIINEEIRRNSNPSQNFASFVTTYMAPQADKLIHNSRQYNLVDCDEYPSIVEIEKRCVNMMLDLYHAEHDGIGVSTVGSSEAMMLAGLAMKRAWQKNRKAQGKSTDKPNLILGTNVQVCWEKFVGYFEVEPRYLPISEDTYVIQPEQIAEVIDENTIGVCAILGTTFTGEFEPIKAINDMLEKKNKQHGWDIPIHLDGASGGFVSPFLYPSKKFDFRIPLVRSVNISGHKYGLVYPGIGWVLWRNEAALPKELIYHLNYLGGDEPTFTLNFSRPAAYVIAQYYNFLHLGREGYTQIMQDLKYLSDYLYDTISDLDDFKMMSNKETIPVVTWQVKKSANYDAFELSDKLRQLGWVVPAYSMPKNAENIVALRVVIREGHTPDAIDAFINDLNTAIKLLTSKKIPVPKTKGGKTNRAC